MLSATDVIQGSVVPTIEALPFGQLGYVRRIWSVESVRFPNAPIAKQLSGPDL